VWLRHDDVGGIYQPSFWDELDGIVRVRNTGSWWDMNFVTTAWLERLDSALDIYHGII
jgi:hypothetical protein